jgi:hypothetical protein
VQTAIGNGSNHFTWVASAEQSGCVSKEVRGFRSIAGQREHIGVLWPLTGAQDSYGHLQRLTGEKGTSIPAGGPAIVKLGAHCPSLQRVRIDGCLRNLTTEMYQNG